MTRKILGILTVITGLALLVLSLTADLLGVGGSSGFNQAQIKVAVVGLVIFFLGLAIINRKLFPNDKINPVLNFSKDNRVFAVLIIIGLGITFIFFFNNLFSRINLETRSYNSNNVFFNAYGGIGADFRKGIYIPGNKLINGESVYLTRPLSNYPPFTHLFFLPLQIFTEDVAYLFFVVLILISNMVSLGLTTILFKDYILIRLGFDKITTNLIAFFLYIVVLIYTITGYSFTFLVDRANYDSIAILISIVSIYLCIKKPKTIWAQVILLSVATHLKIYPAALFLILFLRHGKKIILPAIATNIVLSLALGYNNLIDFIEYMVNYTSNPRLSVSNHSGFAFANRVVRYQPKLTPLLNIFKYAFTFLPLVVWTWSCIVILKMKNFEEKAIAIIMVSIPLMCMLPTVSHDYKLVIVSISLVLLIGFVLVNIVERSRFWDYIMLLLVMGASFALGRSYIFIPVSMNIFRNKYPVLLVFSILMLIIVYLLKGNNAQEPVPSQQIVSTAVSDKDRETGEDQGKKI